MSSSNRRWVASLTIVAGTAFGGLLAARSLPWAATTPDSPERVTVELTANTWTGSTQYEPVIAADTDGRMLVAWSSRRQEDGAFGVFAQLLDPLGRPVGTEIHVNQQIEGAQASPAIAFDRRSGRAMIVWESTHQDGSGAGIIGRWFETSALGAHAATGEIPINATRQGDQTAPSVAINASGQAMIAWTSESGDRSIVAARVFDTQGLPLTEEITLGTLGAHSPLVGASDDGFVIAGAARDEAGNPAPFWMQRLDHGFIPGAMTAIAATSGAQDIEPSVAVDGSGSVHVAWMRRGGNGYDVLRRSFDAQGSAIIPETLVASSAQRRLSGAAIAAAPDGRTMVSWNEEDRIAPSPTDGHGRQARASDVMSVRFDASGAMLGEPKRVNTIAEGRQRLTIGSVAARSIWTAKDQVAHVWNGRTGADGDGVGVTLSRSAGLTAPAPIAFDPRPAVTPDDNAVSAMADAAPVFDPSFVPEPADVTARGVGPDFGFLGTQSTGWRPPDPEIAVGPDHVVVVVNSQITFRRKSDGVQTFSQNLTNAGGFWGAQGAAGFVFDPIAQYDTYTNRFVVAATERAGGQEYIDVAISDDSDPNGAWNKFRINVSAFGGDIDYPIMGIDEDAVYVTVDFFASPTGNWIFILDKADLLAGALTMNAVQTAGGPNVLGSMMNYDADSPAQYFATTYFGGSTQIRLKAVTDPLGAPTLHEHTLGVPSYIQPPGADQLGSTNLVSTVDYRIKHGVVRNGSMWVTHSTNVPDGTGGPFSMDPIARVRWLEIELNGWPTSGMVPTLKQSGTINEGVGIHTWHPDISVDDAGNAAIVFNRSSSDEFISVARAVRRVTDPLGTFRQSVIMQISTTPEPEDRWGDYSGIQEDPSAPGVFWGHSEYRTSSWRTWVGRFSPLTPNPLDFALQSPADEAVEVSVEAVLDWEDAQDADSYDAVIATDPDLINTVALGTVAGSSWAVPAGMLACGTQYYWGVTANGIGGTSGSTPGVFSFTTGLTADINGDGVVDTADLGILIGAFGTAGPSGDLNADGIVDTADLGALIGGFGLTCD
jgi:hypothetical protein